jgi:hypothetical protein
VIKKSFILALYCVLLSPFANAQEFVCSLQNNCFLQQASAISLSKNTRAALPFVDDFSNANSPYPNAAKWIDNKVYINNTFCIQAPTQGVATFDALNEFGNPYPKSATAPSFLADSLTSIPINLNGYSPSDSVYLSFFVQPQGNGFRPEPLDSLKLFFLDNTNTWQLVWGQGGSPNTAFQQKMLKLSNPNFFHTNFQMRFINIASPNTNDDNWNLDYVRLAANRTFTDTMLNDIAFSTMPTSILKEYTSMPFRHFKNYTGLEQAADFAATVQNNYKTANTVGVNLQAMADNISSLKIDNNNLTVQAISEADALYNAYTINYNPSNNNQLVSIKNKFFYTKLNTTENTSNDTITQETIFSNYFAYDDGSAEKAYFLLPAANTPSSTAIQFHTNQTDTLKGLSIHFANQIPSGQGKQFSIVVYQSNSTSAGPAQIIFQKNLNVVNGANTIQGFSNYALDTTLILPAGTYFVGTVQAPNIGADSIYFGLDANTNGNADHFFYNVDGNWNKSTTKGTVMIRPIMGGIPFVPTAITQAGSKELKELIVVPNPATNFIDLQNPQPFTSYQIINVEGKILLHQNAFTKTINITELPIGNYFLQTIHTNGSLLQTAKFLKK